MPPQVSRRWERVRRMGRSRFIRMYGVFGWGLVTGLISSLWMVFGGFNAGNIRPSLLIFVAVVTVPAMMAAGYLWGWWMWTMCEARYARRSARRANPPREGTGWNG